MKREEKRSKKSGAFSAPLCKGICKCAKHACRPRREGFGSAENGEELFFTTLPPLRGPPPLTQGRHKLPDNRSFFCKSTPHPSAYGCHLPPLGKAILKLRTNFPTTEVSFAYFSFQRKVRSKKVRGVYINRYKRGGKATAGGGSGRRTMQNKKFRCKRRHYARKFIEALLF